MGEELNKAVTVKKTKKRWFMLFLLFILTAINYLDRTNMAVAAPSMSSDLGFDAATMGLLFSAFAWSYGLMQIPGGWLLERFGSRVSYTVSLFLWSAFTVAMGFGKSFASLFGIRLAIGAAEAPAFPTNSRVVAAWFPDKERATATSIYTAGEFIGLAFLTPVLFLGSGKLRMAGNLLSHRRHRNYCLLGLALFISRSCRMHRCQSRGVGLYS